MFSSEIVRPRKAIDGTDPGSIKSLGREEELLLVDDDGASADRHMTDLNRRRRESCPISDLVVGLQCGGSDALSGVTANPALGIAADLIIRAGGTVMFSEVTEVRDGIDQLVARALTPDVARDLIREMAWYDDYLAAGRSDRSANTTPGNKKGGLSNIVEKAMGSISKSGVHAHRRCDPGGRACVAKGAAIRRNAGFGFHLWYVAACRGHECARLHHWARHPLWAVRGPGREDRHPHRSGAPLARSCRY